MKRGIIFFIVAAITAVFLFCSNDTLFTPTGLGNYKLNVYAADTTGISSNVPKDSIQSILKTQLSTIPGEPITLFGFVTGDTSKVASKWNFGDGKDTTGTIVVHIYDSAGTYHAVFSITDKEWFSISDTIVITVYRINKSAVKGYARYQGKGAHAGICVVLSDEVSAGNIITMYTGNSGLFQKDSLITNSTYDVTYYDTLYHDAFSPCTLLGIQIKDGKLNILPAITLQDNHPPQIFTYKPSGKLDIRQPSLSANFTDVGSGISPNTFVFTLNGKIIPDTLAKIDTAGFSYVPVQRLPDGVYNLAASIQDSTGNKDTLSWSFTVDAMKLTILTPDTTVRINDTLRLRSLVSNVYSKVALYKWDFDGNSTWDDSVATIDTLVSRPHVYTHDTTYKAILYCRDDSGMVKYDTVTINVGNLPPVISSIRADTTISINDSIQLFGVAHDPDGTIKEYAWDFNGDETFEYTSATQIQTGHRYWTAGIYHAVLRVTDDDNKVTTAMDTITVLQDVPVIMVSTPDTLISIKDTIHLHASATVRSGTILKWEWDCGNTGKFVTTSKGDSAVIAPSTATQAYACVVRATDSKGNTSTATVTVNVLRDAPVIDFLSADTIVDHGGTVRCSVYVQQQFGTMNVEIDTANSGNSKSLGSFGVSGGKTYSFTTGTACLWDSVKVRITDDDGNIVTKAFKVRVRPRPLIITSIDSTVNTITVNFSQSPETDFAEYRIYRNTTNAVDTTNELWATTKTPGTVSCTTSSPSYAWQPRYYRVYQRDSEGVWSAGSNVEYGNIMNSPPAIPMISYPASDGDSIWPNEYLRWTNCADPNGHQVRYRVLVNYNNTGYAQFNTALTNTFVQSTGWDSVLSLKFRVIAYDTLGDSSVWSAERATFIRHAITDFDGNVYHIVTIGTQVWMVGNLKTTKYNDGTAIPLVTDNNAWAYLTYFPAPAYCWYNNDSATYGNTYGALYNWYTVNTGKLAPAGWHVPMHDEWNILLAYLGGADVAGGKLKEAGTTHWAFPNIGATNETGFSALPGGSRSGGTFFNVGLNGNFESATAYNATLSWVISLDLGVALANPVWYDMSWGFSVRCVRDP